MSDHSHPRVLLAPLSRWNGWRKVPAAFKWLTAETKLGPGLLLLAVIDSIAGAILFRGLQPAQGVMSYGDLPGLYTYPPFDWGSVGALSFYPVTNQFAAWAFGNAVGHNLLYLGSLFVPSFGIYLILREFAVANGVSVAVSVSFGTPLNPIWTLDFLTGSFEFGFWWLFLCISIVFFLRAIRLKRAAENSALAGLFSALAVLDASTFGNFEYAATYLAALFMVPLAAYCLVLANGTLRVRVRNVVILASTFILTTVPVWIGAGARYLSFNQSQGGVGTGVRIAVGNVRFTFSQYGMAQALFLQPLHIQHYWSTVEVVSWTIVTVVGLFGALAYSIGETHPHRGALRGFLTVYLALTLVVGGLQSGALLWIYSAAPPLGFLDDPFFTIYPQTLALAIIFGLVVQQLVTAAARTKIVFMHSRRSMSEGESTRSVHYVTFVVAHTETPPPWTSIAVASLLILLAASITGASFSPNLASQLSSSSYTSGESPYIPPYFEDLHGWFVQSGAESSPRDILYLPNDQGPVAQALTYIPSKNLWYIPSTEQLVNSSNNETRYIATLQLLADHQLATFAQALGVEGVRFIVIENVSGPVTLVPTYFEYPPVTVSHNDLLTELNASDSISYSWSDGHFNVFTVDEQLPADVPAIASLSGNTNSSPASPGTELLANPNLASPSDFSNWSKWPTYGPHQLVNGTIAMVVNTSAAVPYSWLADGATLVVNGSLARENVSQSIGFDPTLFTTEYVLRGNVTIPVGVNFYFIIYWYNTSTPLPLFSEFLAQTEGNLTSPLGHSFARTVNVPALAKSARVVLLATTFDANLFATAYLLNVAFDGYVVPLPLSSFPDRLLTAAAVMTSQGALPRDTLVLPSPILVPTNLWRITQIAVVPAAVFDPSLAPTFQVSVRDLEKRTNTSVQFTEAFVMGNAETDLSIELTESDGFNLTKTFINGSTISLIVPVSAESSSILNFTLTSGSLNLSYIGLILSPGASAATSGSVFVPLALGELELEGTRNGWSVTHLPFVQPGPSPTMIQLEGVLEYVPIVAFAGVMVIIAIGRQGGLKLTNRWHGR